MDTPFIFGKIATGENFTDREQETAHLVGNFSSLINTVIISPRRWGKSSLVNRAAHIAQDADEKLVVCNLDLFNVKTENQFYAAFAQCIIQHTSRHLDDALGTIRRFFSHLIPKVSIGTDPVNCFVLDFDWEEVRREPDEVLDLPEKIATEQGIKIMVCIDEFQNVAEFDDPVFFQRKLRAHWQRHQKAGYCLYGSKRHMMLEVFAEPSMPFYKFGDIFFLNKIDTVHFSRFISERFSATGKTISEEACRKLISLADNHPFYVQQLAQLSWLRTQKSCSEETVLQAHAALVEQLGLIFTNLLESFTFQQICFLHAFVSGEKAISSTATMHKYHISSATAASRSLKGLIQKDVFDSNAGKISFQDPIFAYWLKHEYFRR